MSNKIKIAYISAAAVIIASIITGFFTCNSRDASSSMVNQKVDSGNANNAGHDVNSAGRDINNAGRDVNVTNIFGDTSEKKVVKTLKQQQSVVIDQRVISNNQQGGITAHTVIIPEDKEVELKDNFDYSINEEGLGFMISFWPKQGQWNGTFFAVPKSEFEKVVPEFRVGNSMGIRDAFDGNINIEFNKENGPVSCYQTGSMSEEISRNRPGKVFCISLPVEFAFGEYSNLKKAYPISLRK